MEDKILKELENKLYKKKEELEKELKKFAQKDKNLKGDWDTKYPQFGSSSANPVEDSADEVEEYANLLPVEYSLELTLQDINKAIKKIKDKKYGLCEKCKKQIDIERLKALPESKTCKECK